MLPGLMLEQLASGQENFGEVVMGPALERLFARLAGEPGSAPSPAGASVP